MKILFIGLKYDYGVINRGESLERRAFVPAIMKYSTSFHTYWIEEHGFPEDTDKLQKNIIDISFEIQPDLIFFILMKDEIKETTLKLLSKHFQTLNWFCDDQWRFETYSKNISKLFTYVVTVDKYSINKYRQIGVNPIISQWATFDYTENIDFTKIKYDYDVTFIGSKNLSREWIVEELKNNGINVICFGAGWENGKISYDDMKNCFLASKINLNLSNSAPKDISFFKYIIKKLFQNIFNLSTPIKDRINFFKFLKSYFFTKKTIEQIKARNFEIPGCGGFQISKFALGIEEYYLNGKELIMFSDLDELIILIKYYLDNKIEREYIRTRGYNRTSNHTYDQRMKNLFSKLEEFEKN
jgi:spore maturation protein CgeB